MDEEITEETTTKNDAETNAVSAEETTTGTNDGESVAEETE